MFWPMHDQVFALASAQGARAITAESMIDMAEEMGMNRQSFQQCLIGQETLQAVKDSLAQAYSLNLNSTPSLFINEQQIMEPFDYAGITAQIDSLLVEN